MRVIPFGLLVAALAGVILACSVAVRAEAGGLPRGVHEIGFRHWTLTGTNIAKLSRIDSSVTGTLFDSDLTYALGNRLGAQDQVPAGFVAQPALVYRSYADLVSDLRAGRIQPAIRVLLYDPEKWRDTPIQEQRQPLVYMRQFAELAHAEGYRVVLSPARDLMGVRGGDCTAGPGETYAAAYLRCGIPSAAADADSFEIQAQEDETNARAYRSFVAAAAGQAKAAHPGVDVTAVLSSGPGGRAVQPLELLSAAAAVQDVVTGYRLNIRAASATQMLTAVGFLRLLVDG